MGVVYGIAAAPSIDTGSAATPLCASAGERGDTAVRIGGRECDRDRTGEPAVRARGACGDRRRRRLRDVALDGPRPGRFGVPRPVERRVTDRVRPGGREGDRAGDDLVGTAVD